MAMHCAERDRLSAAVSEILEKVIRITQEERRTVERNPRMAYELDRKLEMAIGEKERLMGALRQHENDHGCM